jgi:hypothetical protein
MVPNSEADMRRALDEMVKKARMRGRCVEGRIAIPRSLTINRTYATSGALDTKSPRNGFEPFEVFHGQI